MVINTGVPAHTLHCTKYPLVQVYDKRVHVVMLHFYTWEMKQLKASSPTCEQVLTSVLRQSLHPAMLEEESTGTRQTGTDVLLHIVRPGKVNGTFQWPTDSTQISSRNRSRRLCTKSTKTTHRFARQPPVQANPSVRGSVVPSRT